MYKTQMFFGNNLDGIKKTMDLWFEQNPNIEIVSQSQSAVPSINADHRRQNIVITLVYSDGIKKAGRKARKKIQLNG